MPSEPRGDEPERRRVTLFHANAPRGSTAMRVSQAGLALGVVPFLCAFLFAMPALMALGLMIWILSSAVLLPCKLHIGADGLFIATRIAPTFVAWSDVAAVDLDDRGTVLHRANGTRVSIPMVMPGSRVSEEDRARARSFLAHVAIAREAYRLAQPPAATVLLARKQRSHAEWMRALSDREGSFRAVPLLDDQLWAVVESPAAEATARAGAALVLARAGREEDRTRLRVAAEACAAPRLRVVLDKAASGVALPEVEAALSAIADDHRLADAER